MNRPFVVFLSAATLCAATSAGYFYLENAELKRLLEKEDPATAANEADFARNAIASEQDEPEMVELDDAAAIASLTDSQRELVVAQFENERRAQRDQARSERMQSRMQRFENPELRMDLIERNLDRVHRRYEDFFVGLELGDVEIDAIKTLMAEGDVTRWESLMRGGAATSEEERAQIKREMDERRAGLQADIDEILGEDQAADLARYNRELPFKGDVEEFARSMSFSSSPIESDQSAALVTAMAQVAQEFEYTVEVGDNPWRMRDLSAGDQVAYLQEKEQFDLMVLNAASDVLDESQMNGLAEMQVAERERLERQVEFESQNGGGPGGRRRGGFGRR